MWAISFSRPHAAFPCRASGWGYFVFLKSTLQTSLLWSRVTPRGRLGRSHSRRGKMRLRKPFPTSPQSPLQLTKPTSHLIFVSIRQRFGSLGIFRKTDVKAQDISLAIARRIVLPYWLMKLGSLLAAPGVTELVVSQRCLEVPCRNQCIQIVSGTLLYAQPFMFWPNNYIQLINTTVISTNTVTKALSKAKHAAV